MTIPALVFGSIIAFIIGTVFHLIIGGGFIRIIITIVSSLIGFWIGHFIGYKIGLSFWNMGLIQLGPAIIGSLLFLVLGYWLTMVRIEPR